MGFTNMPAKLMASLARHTKQVLLLAGCSLMVVSCDEPQPSIALGTLERNRILLSARANEKITDIFVHKGAKVLAGQPLLQLDNLRQQRQLDASIAQLQQAQAQLKDLENGARDEDIDAAKAQLNVNKSQLTLAKLKWQRAQKLRTEKNLSQADLDQATSHYHQATAAMAKAKAQLARLKAGARPQQIRAALAQVKQLQAHVAQQQQQLNELTLIAPLDATVDSLPFLPGEDVTIGTTLVILQDTQAPFARLYLPQSVRLKVAPGDAVMVNIQRQDSAEQTKFKGVITAIAAEPSFTPYYALNQKERSRLVYMTEVQLGADAKHLPSGISIEAEF